MKSRQIVKIAVDAAMTVILLLLMAYELIGQAAHEWLGIGIFVLFVLHHGLNSKWTRHVRTGKYTAPRVLQTVLVVLALLSMLGSMVSGVVLSRHALSFLAISGGSSFARKLHMLSSYWGFVLMSLHLGFHWNMMMEMAKRLTKAPSKYRKWVLRGITLLIVGYGLYAFIKRDIGSYMLFINQFAFFDFEEPIIWFLLDYAACMGMFTAVGHYLSCALRAKALKKNKKRNGETTMKKRFLSFTMAVCMVCLLTLTSCSAAEVPAADRNLGAEPLATQSAQTAGFSDVPADVWYAEAVAYCQQHGIMSGTSDTTFAPEETLTRAMLAAVLYRMNGSPAVPAPPAFTDAVAGAWYSDAVSWAASNRVISGYGNSTFGVNDPTTREQAVTILWRSAGSPESVASADVSDAASVSTWAQTAVRWADANGILTGMTNNRRFDPKTNIKRGEVASMLYHYLNSTTSSQPEPAAGGKTLVAYFSATNTTRPLAEYAADILNTDLYEIVPEVPYTDADLAYYTNGRADREQNDSTARPAISGSVENMADYDVILLGYPIWHGQPPRIISTFLESYDLTGKTIIPFCTSHSSGYSDSSIKSLAPGANWITGRRFAGGTSRSAVEEWINGLELPEPAAPASNKTAFNFETKSVTLNSGYTMPINGLGTYSLHGETCVNAVKSALFSGVRLIDTASAYGNEEEVGQAIREAIDEQGIKREDIFVITKIYPGSEMADPEQSIQACLDRLNIDYVDMMLLHHPDRNDVKAYQAMEKFVESGKIRSLGLSNWYVKELESFLPQVTITPALVQNEIHPYYQENDVIPYIQDLGIVVQGWYPLGGRGHTAELLGDEVISNIAKAHGVSSAQVILRWNLQKGVVVIPGSSNPDHIKENTELYGFSLTNEEMAQVNALDRGEKHDWY